MLEGGGGNDRIYLGLGRDRAAGGAGNDRILAQDGRRDEIDCGPGQDVVQSDRADVLRGFERGAGASRARPSA